MREPLLVLPHIEKTGGTSILKHIDDRFPDDEILRYKPHYGYLMHSELNAGTFSMHRLFAGLLALLEDDSELRRQILKYSHARTFPVDLFNTVSVVRGHFNADALDQIERPQQIAMVFRDPLVRMISQYLHYTRRNGKTNWRVKHPPNMTLEEYLLDPKNANFQSKCLGSKELDDIDVIGITDDLRDFAAKLGVIDSADKLVRLNGSPSGEVQQVRSGMSRAFLRTFWETHSLDQELYEAVLDRIYAEPQGSTYYSHGAATVTA